MHSGCPALQASVAVAYSAHVDVIAVSSQEEQIAVVEQSAKLLVANVWAQSLAACLQAATSAEALLLLKAPVMNNTTIAAIAKTAAIIIKYSKLP